MKRKINSVADTLKVLDFVADMLPVPFFWLTLNHVVLGLNDFAVKAIGGEVKNDFIGKTVHEVYYKNKEIADELCRLNEKVILTKKTLIAEDKIVDVTTGQVKYFIAARAPLYDLDNNLIGVIGSSVDVTAQKEAEELKRENEWLEFENKTQKLLTQEHESFRKIVGQVNHDIRSPLTSLQMLNKQCANLLPKTKHEAYQKAITRIVDIATNMMGYFAPQKDKSQTEKQQIVLAAPEILDILTEKKYEYYGRDIEINYNFSQDSNFAFVKIESGTFKRMLSNIINNSVDALTGQTGKINIYLEIIEEKLQIIIQDNGKGMPPDLKDKLLRNIKVTSGKTQGYGIGFTQIREALIKNNSTMTIESEIGIGTKIIINIPKVKTPEWIATQIELYPDDIIVIVDDDVSIHEAWMGRLKVEMPNIMVKSFEFGNDAISYINQLADKDAIFLLTDYELLGQGIHGLDIVHKTKVKRSILVTSHYNNQNILTLAALTNTRVLPKPLSSEIPIISLKNNNSKYPPSHGIVDLVIIDDDKDLVNDLVEIEFAQKKVDVYYTPEDFLTNISLYTPTTTMLVDHEFKGGKMTGIQIIEQLHQRKFSNVYLYSGRTFNNGELPPYVKVIMKDDLEAISNIFTT